MADSVNNPVDATMSRNPAASDDVLTDDGGIANGPEVRLKNRGRDRLLRGLQRISSSPSLPRIGRSRSQSAPYSLPGALSCVSLASTASPFGQPSAGSYFSQSSAGGISSTHTSIPPSPIAEYPGHEALESVLAVRPVDCATPGSITVFLPPKVRKKAGIFSLWAAMPHELKVYVLSFLRPKELVQASRVCKEFHKMCFDGQLWTRLDASEFYRDIPAESLAKIIMSAGPFVKDLNLRGCLQVEHYQKTEVMVQACRNLINATLEGCRNFKRSTLHNLLKANDKLAHLNLTGLPAVNNATCKIVAESCPQLEVFNVSWCKHMDARGLNFVINGCPKLRDLRAGEIKGFGNTDVAEAIFRTNNLERLVLAGCDDLTDDALKIMVQGQDPEIDYLTDRPMVPPRKLRHLDVTRCSRLTSAGVKALGHFVPHLEGLQLSGVAHLTDAGLEPILASTPRLTHLEFEDCSELTNSLLSQHLAKAPCAPGLEHLSISYCENLGDAGMLPVMRACTRLRSVYMDNTRVSDLVLAEAAAMVRERAASSSSLSRRRNSTTATTLPAVTLNLVVYDCPNITWTGVREVLSRNTDLSSFTPATEQSSKTPNVTITEHDGDASPPAATAPTLTPRRRSNPPRSGPAEVISLRCFYGWQMTVDEHLKRVLRGDVAAAARLERKWADYMQASEEASAVGAGGRRRRRRAREAQAVHDLEEGTGDGEGNGDQRDDGGEEEGENEEGTGIGDGSAGSEGGESHGGQGEEAAVGDREIEGSGSTGGDADEFGTGSDCENEGKNGGEGQEQQAVDEQASAAKSQPTSPRPASPHTASPQPVLTTAEQPETTENEIGRERVATQKLNDNDNTDTDSSTNSDTDDETITPNPPPRSTSPTTTHNTSTPNNPPQTIRLDHLNTSTKLHGTYTTLPAANRAALATFLALAKPRNSAIEDHHYYRYFLEPDFTGQFREAGLGERGCTVAAELEFPPPAGRQYRWGFTRLVVEVVESELRGPIEIGDMVVEGVIEKDST